MHSPYHADQLPPLLQQESDSAARGGHAGNLAAATRIASASHEAISQAGAREFAGEPERAKRQSGYFKVANQVRPEEEKALAQWAAESGNLSESKEFERRWIAQGEKGGAEHRVYFDQETQCWFKANNLSYHATWLEYFQRLALHNWIFPNTPLKFEGLMRTPEGLESLVSQGHIIADRGAETEKVGEYMAALGFHQIGQTNNYLNEKHGIRVEDLHDENAIITPGNLLVIIDPIPYMEITSKLARLR